MTREHHINYIRVHLLCAWPLCCESHNIALLATCRARNTYHAEQALTTRCRTRLKVALATLTTDR